MSIIVRSNEPVAAPAQASSHEATEAPAGAKEQSSAPAEKAEQNESTDSETGETEETEGSETESEKSESGEENDAEKAPKKKGGFQRRIDKLNAAKAAAQQEAEYWKREALKNATESKSDAPKVDPAKPEANAGKPDPGIFDTHAEYVEALTDWKIEQRQKVDSEKQQRANFETEQAKLARSYTERVKSFSEKQADFADVLSEVDHVPVSPAIREIILSSENGPELAYELAKNPEEFERVCSLSPLAAAREMGKIEARIAAKAPSEAKPETKKITNAPKPLEPVKAGGKGSTAKSISDPNLSQAEYERLRREQIKRRQG